jgi:hypothetical protein
MMVNSYYGIYQAGDLFNVGELNERLADLSTILIPAR